MGLPSSFINQTTVLTNAENEDLRLIKVTYLCGRHHLPCQQILITSLNRLETGLLPSMEQLRDCAIRTPSRCQNLSVMQPAESAGESCVINNTILAAMAADYCSIPHQSIAMSLLCGCPSCSRVPSHKRRLQHQQLAYNIPSSGVQIHVCGMQPDAFLQRQRDGTAYNAMQLGTRSFACLRVKENLRPADMPMALPAP